MPIIEFSPALLSPKWLSLNAVMLFPDPVADADNRKNFIEAITAAGVTIHIKNKPGLISTQVAYALATAPRPETLGIEDAQRRGRISGMMLYFMLSFFADNNTRMYASLASVTRAIRFLAPGEKKRGYDIQTLRKLVWRRYEPVAHLWAARIAWKELGELSETTDVPHRDDAEFDAFLSLAEHFRQLGEKWGHDKGPPFLDGNRMWVVSPNLTLPPPAHTFGKVVLDERAIRALTDRNRGKRG